MSYIVQAHRANLTPEAIGPRREFDARFARYCADLHRAFAATMPARPTALSIGCGLGFDVIALRGIGYEAFGFEIADMADIWPALHGEAARGMAVTDGSIPFGAATFDLILSFNVFEHVGTVPPQEIVTSGTAAARQRFVAQAIARLKPGGVFVLVAPNKAFPLDYGHNHWYGPLWSRVNRRHGARGWSLANPFGRSNFLPSIADVVRIAQHINAREPISLTLLDDYSLHGFQQHTGAAATMAAAWAQACRIARPARAGFFINPTIQAIFVKGAAAPPDLGDVRLVDPHGAATWTRRAFSPAYNATWSTPLGAQQDLVTLLHADAASLRFRREGNGAIYAGKVAASGDIVGEVSTADAAPMPWSGRLINSRLWPIRLPRAGQR